jgi:imidazoleglycerol-phosphate dehydratase/histidinol-phosphatase
MLVKYIYGDNLMKSSFVIGDRETDVQLAKNLGCQSIRISQDLTSKADFLVNSWNDILQIMKNGSRSAEFSRKSKETEIHINCNLDGSGHSNINSGIGFFDHMCEQIAKHSGFDITLDVKGDLHVDDHHTVEDVAIALGSCILKALGHKKYIQRYAFVCPMDDAQSSIVLDLGGRPYLRWKAKFNREKIGEMSTELFKHFFLSLSDSLRANIQIKVDGENEHHKIEAIFKGFAKCLGMAARQDSDTIIASTKGVL